MSSLRNWGVAKSLCLAVGLSLVSASVAEAAKMQQFSRHQPKDVTLYQADTTWVDPYFPMKMTMPWETGDCGLLWAAQDNVVNPPPCDTINWGPDMVKMQQMGYYLDSAWWAIDKNWMLEIEAMMIKMPVPTNGLKTTPELQQTNYNGATEYWLIWAAPNGGYSDGLICRQVVETQSAVAVTATIYPDMTKLKDFCHQMMEVRNGQTDIYNMNMDNWVGMDYAWIRIDPMHMPEPAAGLIFLAGLSGLGWLRRRNI